MATITLTGSEAKVARTSGGIGAYKDSSPVLYSKETEINGTAEAPPASYPNYLPVWDQKTKFVCPVPSRLARKSSTSIESTAVVRREPVPGSSCSPYEPLTEFEHHEHGKAADPSLPDLLKSGSKTIDIAASIGAEVCGVQLSELSDKGKDQLALFVAQKKVVVFRDQDFASLTISEALEYGRYFGRLHIHPTSGAPEGYPEVHLVHRAAGDTAAQDFFATRTNSIAWHSDITYEKQPPGTTFLYALDVPEAGGDTLFLNQAAAYRRLSPAFRQRLEGLEAVHSGNEQEQSALAKGGVVRRTPVTNVHPLVRTHPATGEKALWVNSQFTRDIVGFKKEESEYLLNFLYNHMAMSQDIQCRVKWAPGTVVVWDNRVTAHSALLDWEDKARRHLARITPQAEAPTE